MDTTGLNQAIGFSNQTQNVQKIVLQGQRFKPWAYKKSYYKVRESNPRPTETVYVLRNKTCALRASTFHVERFRLIMDKGQTYQKRMMDRLSQKRLNQSKKDMFHAKHIFSGTHIYWVCVYLYTPPCPTVGHK